MAVLRHPVLEHGAIQPQKNVAEELVVRQRADGGELELRELLLVRAGPRTRIKILQNLKT